MRTYQLIADPPAIRCLICQHVSFHEANVARHYCVICKRYHDDVQANVELALGNILNHARPDLPPAVRRHLLDIVLDMLDPANTNSSSGVPVPLYARPH